MLWEYDAGEPRSFSPHPRVCLPTASSPYNSAMKFATWNVNGIRARAAQVQEWIEREQPDVICLQELKAELTQVPEVVQRAEYHAFWHCCKGYSGVSLQLRKDIFPTA